MEQDFPIELIVKRVIVSSYAISREMAAIIKEKQSNLIWEDDAELREEIETTLSKAGFTPVPIRDSYDIY